MFTYNEIITNTRQDEVKRRQEEILKIIEDSKEYVTRCDNLLKLRALKTRCEKITNPRAPREKKQTENES